MTETGRDQAHNDSSSPYVAHLGDRMRDRLALRVRDHLHPAHQPISIVQADDARLRIGEAWQHHENAAKSAPVEITAERFHEMLNILPPVAWYSTSDGESFKMSERITGMITAIFVRIGERYFEFNDNIRLKHAECCKRVAESDAFRNPAPPAVT